MSKDAGEYRQKDLFDGRSFNATRLEITRNGQSSLFEKTKTKNKAGQDEEKWKQSAPTARDVDRRPSTITSAVTGARATSLADTAAKTGLDKPELVITLTTDEGKRVEKVSFSRNGGEGYAARDGEPGIAKVDAATIDNIAKSLEGIK